MLFKSNSGAIMTKFHTILAAVGMVSLTTPASAAVVIDATGTPQGVGTVGTVGGGSSLVGVEFDWSGTPVTQFVEFTTDNGFDILFSSFVSNGGNSDVSGLVVDRLDSVNGDTRLTTDTNACTNAAAPVAGQCNFFAPNGANSGNASGALKPGSTVFSNLASGSYPHRHLRQRDAERRHGQLCHSGTAASGRSGPGRARPFGPWRSRSRPAPPRAITTFRMRADFQPVSF